MAKKAAVKQVRSTQKQEPKHLWGVLDGAGDFQYDAVPFDVMTQEEALSHLGEMDPDFSPYQLYRMELVGTLTVNGTVFTPVGK